MNFGITKKSLDYIVNALSQSQRIEKASIFGSRAMDNYKKGSDIDLVIFGHEIDAESVNWLSITVNEELPIPYYIDVVHYESLESVSLKEHIDRYSKLLYEQKKDV